MSREVRIALAVTAVWTGLVIGAAVATIDFGSRHVDRLALHQSRALFQAVVDFRAWNLSHGGIYVRVTEETPPNPYLQVPNRDVATTDGLELTLVNPAYMTRQFAELSIRRQGVDVHITSLQPLRPANAPEPWEREALEAFEMGLDEVSGYTDSSAGQSLFRYMAPLVTEQSCLPCHEAQGYREGDIRGGISVTYPAEPFVAARTIYRNNVILVAAAIWMLGLALIVAVNRSFRSSRATVVRLRELSLVDTLTSVHNRRGFVALAEQALHSASRRGQKALLAFFDLDDLKSINDRYGHDEGDASLRRVAGVLKSALRASDIVARMGGDEFVAMLMDTSSDDAEAVRRRLQEAFERENERVSKPYELSVSFGLVEFDPASPMSLEDLVREADRDMYARKNVEAD